MTLLYCRAISSITWKVHWIASLGLFFKYFPTLNFSPSRLLRTVHSVTIYLDCNPPTLPISGRACRRLPWIVQRSINANAWLRIAEKLSRPLEWFREIPTPPIGRAKTKIQRVVRTLHITRPNDASVRSSGTFSSSIIHIQRHIPLQLSHKTNWNKSFTLNFIRSR